MKLPRTIRIQGVRWRIKTVKNLTDESGFPLAGCCCFQTKTITVLVATKKEMFLSLVHEAVHAISMQSGIHTLVTFSPDQEEIMAEQIANFALDHFGFLLRDSKK